MLIGMAPVGSPWGHVLLPLKVLMGVDVYVSMERWLGIPELSLKAHLTLTFGI